MGSFEILADIKNPLTEWTQTPSGEWVDPNRKVEWEGDDSEEDSDEIIQEVYSIQEKLIAEKYGTEAAEQANYAAGLQQGSIATKVYLNSGNVTLESNFSTDGDSITKISHRWIAD